MFHLGKATFLFSQKYQWFCVFTHKHFFTNFYTAAQSHSVSCSFHLHTQHQVAVAANHSNSFSHKHALPVTGNPFSIALPFSGTLSHKTFKHTPTAPHSGKPLNSTGQHTDTQPNKTFPYHSLLPSLNYLTIYTTYTPIAFLCNINFCMSSLLQHLSLHIYSNM